MYNRKPASRQTPISSIYYDFELMYLEDEMEFFRGHSVGVRYCFNTKQLDKFERMLKLRNFFYEIRIIDNTCYEVTWSKKRSLANFKQIREENDILLEAVT